MIRANDFYDKDYITQKIGQEKIMSYYLKVPIDLNKLFVSPLRNDKHPTCSF